MRSLETKSEPELTNPTSRSCPSFYVSADQMPEIKDWAVDEEYTVTFKIRMRNKNESITLEKHHVDAGFDILAYEAE